MGKPNDSLNTAENDNQPTVDMVAVRAAQATFLASAITMTWQLAIVIIIPIVVGFKLDKHLHSSPLWTLIGLAIAALGMGAVLWQSVRAVSPKSVAEHK